MKNKKGFTLIELMITISIMGIMMMIAYAPYNFFQKKVEIKIAANEISKTLSESRNLAIHGTSSGGINQSIGVYFDKNNKNIIKIFSYDFNNRMHKSLLRVVKIQPNIWINEINGNNKALFYYDSITGSGSFYKDDSFIDSISNDVMKIKFSYKNASSTSLQKSIIYYTKTYISDY